MAFWPYCWYCLPAWKINDTLTKWKWIFPPPIYYLAWLPLVHLSGDKHFSSNLVYKPAPRLGISVFSDHWNTFPSPDLPRDLNSSACHQGTEHFPVAFSCLRGPLSLFLGSYPDLPEVVPYLDSSQNDECSSLIEWQGILVWWWWRWMLLVNRKSHFEAYNPGFTANSFSASS